MEREACSIHPARCEGLSFRDPCAREEVQGYAGSRKDARRPCHPDHLRFQGSRAGRMSWEGKSSVSRKWKKRAFVLEMGRRCRNACLAAGKRARDAGKNGRNPGPSRAAHRMAYGERQSGRTCERPCSPCRHHGPHLL